MRKRNLSEFMCIEMLYDYKLGKLDPLRNQAVEEGMAGSPRVREELQKLTAGFNFCSQLRRTKVEDAVVQYVLSQPKTSKKILSQLSWSGLPKSLRWTLEAAIVAVAISLFVIQTPRIFKHITRIENTQSVTAQFDLPTITDQKITDLKTDDVPKEKNSAIVAKPSEEKLSAETKLSTATPVAQTKEPSPSQSPKQESQSQGVIAENKSSQEKVVKKGNAYLYRMVMQSDDVDKITPEIKKIITDLGGEKAGDVELGWRRRGGSYFHFALPKINNQAFQDSLKKIGPFSINKTAHPRVMPPDKERFILWVEEKPKSIPETSEGDSSEGGQETEPNDQENLKSKPADGPATTSSPDATNPEPDGKNADPQ